MANPTASPGAGPDRDAGVQSPVCKVTDGLSIPQLGTGRGGGRAGRPRLSVAGGRLEWTRGLGNDLDDPSPARGGSGWTRGWGSGATASRWPGGVSGRTRRGAWLCPPREGQPRGGSPAPRAPPAARQPRTGAGLGWGTRGSRDSSWGSLLRGRGAGRRRAAGPTSSVAVGQ